MQLGSTNISDRVTSCSLRQTMLIAEKHCILSNVAKKQQADFNGRTSCQRRSRLMGLGTPTLVSVAVSGAVG
jgi:hypothetical protein